jgi:SAM-dependent methyltransferase
MIRPHNENAARVWGAGGAAYEAVSALLADAVEHAVLRLDPRPGERILDVATGTGIAARRCAARGAEVTGVDLGADLVAAARELGPGIEFRVGDAEELPFGDGAFDGVISTFGAMFVSRPEAAAAELARVCREGGRIALAAWTPGGSVEEKFELMKPYFKSPPKGPSPFEWGRPERVRELLGGAFELGFEEGVSTIRLRDGAAAWELFVRGYGPVKALAESLEPARREQFRRDFEAYYERRRTGLGVSVPREYLVAAGLRR